MMALQMKNVVGDGAYYQSAQYCRNYTSPPVSYNDSSHYLPRLPGPEAMLKPTFSLFSHPQQPFHHMGPLSMAPTQPLGPPAMAPAQAIGPPTLALTQSLGPPPIPGSHTLGTPTINRAPSLGPRGINPAHHLGPPTINPAHSVGPPPISLAHSLGPPNGNPAHHLGPSTINPAHSLGPPPMAPAQPLGPPPMAHALGPPPIDPMQALGGPPSMDLAQPLGAPPLNPTQALGPPAVLAPGTGRFSHPPSPLSSPPPPTPDHSQLPPRPPIPASIQALISGPIPGPLAGPLPAQAAPSSEQSQDEGSTLGMEEQEEGSLLGLEELCKPLYCKLCNVTLNSAQQAQAHYQGKNHSKKLRNFYAGSQQPPAIRSPEVLETVSPTVLSGGPKDGDTSRQALYKGAARVILATENDYCKLCDASFSSPAVAQAHYQGKNHAKRLRLAEAQHNTNNTEGSETNQRRNRKDGSEYRLVKNRRSPQIPVAMPGPYYNPRPRQRIPRDLAMCVTPSGQFYCSMCNCGAEQETDFRLHLESKQHKAKVSELRYRSEMENLGYS